MKKIYQIMLIILIALVLNIFFGWWAIFVPGLIAGAVFPQDKNRKAFWRSFIALFLYWLSATFIIYIDADYLPVDRMAGVFSLPSGIFLILVTGLIAGLAGGFTDLGANCIRKSVVRNT